MSTITRPGKTNGTNSYQDGDDILASEVNGDIDLIVNDYNGSIDNSNIASSAGIRPQKLDDYAFDDTEFHTVSDPGDTNAISKPTTMAGELSKIRYRVGSSVLPVGTKVRRGVVMVDSAWTEPGFTGHNLIINPGFELQTGGSGTAPNGWTLSGTPTTCVIEAPTSTSAGTDKRSLNMIGSGTGIYQVVTNMKASTRYLLTVSYVRTTGAFSIQTTGGLSSSTNHGNVVISDSSSSGYTTSSSVFETDSSGSDITVTLLTTGGASAEVNLFYVSLVECGENGPHEQVSVPAVTDTLATSTALTGTLSSGLDWLTITALTNTIHVPGPGYRLVIDAQIPYELDVGDAFAATSPYPVFYRMQINGSTVLGPLMELAAPVTGASANGLGTISVHWVIDNPGSGTDQVVSFDIGIYAIKTINICPVETWTSEQTAAHVVLRLERN